MIRVLAGVFCAVVAVAVAMAGCGAPEACHGGCGRIGQDGSVLDLGGVDRPAGDLAGTGGTGGSGTGTGGSGTDTGGGAGGTGGTGVGGSGAGGTSAAGTGGSAATGTGGTGTVDAGMTPDTGGPRDTGVDMTGAEPPRDTGGTVDAGMEARPDVPTLPPNLLAFYPFDQASGTTATDTSGNGHNGTLAGGATFVAGMVRNAVSLNGTNGYVDLPDGILQAATAMTVTVWVRLRADQTWARVFDFGSSATINMFFTPHASTGNIPRFAITTTGNAGEQHIDGTALLPLNTWKHLAVTLDGTNGTLYIDGARVTTSPVTLRPSDLAATTNNWIGRSQYAVDPYLNGDVDELRLYNRALTAAEITTLYTQR